MTLLVLLLLPIVIVQTNNVISVPGT